MKRLALLFVCLICISAYSIAQNSTIAYNLLASTFSPINIEYNYIASNKISVYANVKYNPISFNNRKYIILSQGVKYWLWHQNAGFFYGFGGNYSKYNIELKRWRYQGYSVGMGCLAGYSKIINYKTNVEISAGLGIYYINNDQFLKGLCGDFERSNSKLCIAPYQLSISIVRIINIR